MKDEKFGRKTAPGFGDPRAAVRPNEVSMRTPVRVGALQPSVNPPANNARATGAPPSSNRPRAARGKPLVEIEVTRERTRTPRPPMPGCYEIWTQNHVYSLDSRMRCVEVRTPQGNEVRTEHPFLGARLVGGQAQDDAMEMSHPLPRPGAFAVFELKKKNRRHFVRTSPVDRVVLRMRIVTIADGSDAPSWEDVVDEDE